MVKEVNRLTTKHQQILDYIEQIPIGEKLSVRKIARQLDVSEGTAYRAIREADNMGLVRTIQRVGTIRTETPKKAEIESLNFHEVLNVIDGEAIGGKAGLDRELIKFVIGAMQIDAMKRYISEGSLVIVGNRTDAQKLSLELGAAVLITGGFSADQEIIDLADELNLPLMTTTYDTFTVATMINRAMSDQLIEKEILQIQDIYTDLEKTEFLYESDKVTTYHDLNEKSNHSRFPVVNQLHQLVGMITPKDIIGASKHNPIKDVMTKSPTTVNLSTSIANASHMMIWEGYELLPVVEEDLTLLGVISRQDVMRAMQSVQKQSQIGDTISDQMRQAIEMVSPEEYRVKVRPQMINSTGTIATGVLAELLTKVVRDVLSRKTNHHMIIEQIHITYLKMVELDAELSIFPNIYEKNRRIFHLDIEVFQEDAIVAKALINCQVFRPQ